ncbi:MAG: PLP-dependent transferase, partial [Phycisphaerales bacterium]|nr:PLP-dependent transferase [Phycisphaerales bacterium]
MTQSHEAGFETLCMHYGENREAMFGAAAPPIFQNSTFTYPDSASFHTRQDADATRFDYTRTGNPTTRILERKIAKLEQGEDCRAFGSGMGAISAAILSCVKAGDHVVTIETVYGPTRRLFSEFLPRFGVETTYVRGTSIEDFEGAIRPNTRLFFVESPSSLFFELQDLTAVARLAREHDIVTMCDNSNATPVFQNPITMGVDVVIHTATKYIGGH